MFVAVTADKFLQYGIDLIGYNDRQQSGMSWAVKQDNFRLHFGSQPHVIEKIWDDLLKTTNPAAQVDEESRDPVKFLMAHYFLHMYPKERAMPPLFHLCRNTIRTWVWYFIRKMEALKDNKIKWPEGWKDAKERMLYTVDGVHFWTREAPHPTLPYDKKSYSHKNKQAGLSYEIGVSLEEDRIVWFSGPWPAGESDIAIFKKPNGLKSKTPDTCVGIADNGYRGERYDKLAIPNSKDSPQVSRFKSISRARQESLNRRLKVFQCLSQKFRHTPKTRHLPIFTAVCVIVQYQMELGQPLFDL
jgi:hypothetical protein